MRNALSVLDAYDQRGVDAIEGLRDRALKTNRGLGALSPRNQLYFDIIEDWRTVVIQYQTGLVPK